MNWSFVFFFNSVLLSVGLAMDAFSVSMANGLNEPKMKSGRISLIAGCYGCHANDWLDLCSYYCGLLSEI